MKLTNGEDVDKAVIAGGNVDTFATAVKVVKSAGKIGSVNYTSSGDFIKIPVQEWGVGMFDKQINGSIMPAGKLHI